MWGLDIDIDIADFHNSDYPAVYVWIKYRVNIYKRSNILFSRNNKIFKEGFEQADYVIENYYDENNFQYASCIGEIKPVGKPTRLYQLDLYWIPIFSK